ncbi:4'-phosphopantetheinyl transferase family protein [Allorhizocola rhizosphaerae]|uniref:4'-phosphopantetheinyl transferase family protein n=1 Tax=Allorhizocola rhizosphaerae TaxID=1872709 RepID=UPI000E3C48E5|nr:4'-phosphopantetheinyl transferase superfamily protein [Allorhizocola rhizosphaerae]
MPRLPEGVDVWHIRLDAGPSAVDRAAVVLDAHELRRAGRFREALDARRYVVAHGAIRCVLGEYLGVAAGAVCWTAGVHGKPAFTGPWSRWQWSMSRSAGHALLAVRAAGPVGVDIERIGDRTPAMALADRYLPEEEAEFVAAQPDSSARRMAYHKILARKEACVKASGGRFLEGLRLRVLTPPHGRGSLASEAAAMSRGLLSRPPGRVGTVVGTGAFAGHRWDLRDLPAPQGFVAALATSGRAVERVRFYEWEAAAQLPGQPPRSRPPNGYGAIQLVPGE